MSESNDSVGKVHDIVLKSLDKIDRVTDHLRTDLQNVRQEVQGMAVEMAKAEAIPRELDRLDGRVTDIDAKLATLTAEQAAASAVQGRLERWLPYLLAIGLGGNYVRDFVQADPVVLQSPASQPVGE